METDYSNPVGLNFTEFAGGFQNLCSRKDCQKTGSRAAFSLDLSLRLTLLVFSNEELILQTPDSEQLDSTNSKTLGNSSGAMP